jgi:hypothetical protein
MNLERVVEFVSSKGNAVEQARLKYLLANERPSQEVVATLFAGQRPDGGWPPFWANDYTSLDATCFRLAQAEQLGIGKSETAIIRAVHFLAQRQSSDGTWEEDKRVADFAPPWATPGDLSAKLYLTANCGLWLALLGNTNNGISKAAAYLHAHLDQDGHLPSFLHTHWLAGGLWRKLNWQESSERVFEYLGTRINDLAASNLSWLITTACAAGVPTNHQFVDKAASLLQQSQRDDGCWSSEDGPSQDVHSTLEAIRALWLCGRVVKQ